MNLFKKLGLMPTFVLLRFSLPVFFVLLFLLSCNKNLVEPTQQVPNKSITVEEAQNYYSSTIVNSKNTAREQADPIEFKNLEKSPKWERAINKVVEGQDVVIVPVRYNKYRALRYSNSKQSNSKGLVKDDSQVGLDETSFLYFYKNDSGDVIYEIVVSVPTQTWARNPKKQFSGYTIVSDGEMNFKRGVVFKDGEVAGGFGLDKTDKRGRTTEICGWIEQWGYNYVVDATGTPISERFYVSYGTIPVYCTLAPEISTGYQLPANSYNGIGAYYSLPPQLTEAEYFESVFYVDPGDKKIDNLPNYLRCFSNSSSNIYKVTVSVDQPIAGNSTPVNPLSFDKHKVGHTYLTLTQINSNGETTQRTMGFYPSYGGSPLNPSVPSEIHDDSQYSGGWDVQLTFQVTGAEMMQIVNFIPSYTNINYDLSNRNCGNFALDALGQIGISVAPYWMNTFWYSSTNPNYGGYSSPSEIRGPSIGALGEQLYNTPPSRTTSKSHAGGSAPRNMGTCN